MALRWDIIVLIVLVVICVLMIRKRIAVSNELKREHNPFWQNEQASRDEVDQEASANEPALSPQHAVLWAKLSLPAAALVDNEIEKGRMLNAIKLFREKSGASLRKSKDAVEARRDQKER